VQPQRQQSVQPQRQQSVQPQRQQQQRGSYDPRSNGSRNGGSYGSRTAPLRQAIPAPRDRYIDLNRNGRDDRYDNRGGYYGNSYGGNYYRPTYRGSYIPSYRYSGPRIVIAPRYSQRFSSAWFSFRPRTRFSFGLTLGYPVAFPSWYDPYIVGQPGYTRPYMSYGGVSFDVEPRDADLFVDGEYVGRVSDFTSYDPPLTLVAGRHHVEIASGDYRVVEFDITILANQVIPYQGTLPYVR
jgi:hypothetical protein